MGRSLSFQDSSRGPIMTPVAANKKRRKFDLKNFLLTIAAGRTIADIFKK